MSGHTSMDPFHDGHHAQNVSIGRARPRKRRRIKEMTDFISTDEDDEEATGDYSDAGQSHSYLAV